MFSRFKSLITLIALVVSGAVLTAAQETTDNTPNVQPTPSVQPTPTSQVNPQNVTQPLATDKKNSEDNYTAEQIAESSIFIYGGGLGRINLNQIRKTTYERGTISTTNAEGKREQVKYERWVLRGENLETEKVRFDKEFPNTKFALISGGDEDIFLLFNNIVYKPQADAVKEFENRIWHGLEALLRYKENGSTLELIGRDKILGVEFYVLDVTDKEKRKTRFYISIKSLKVMMLEYEEDSIKYRRKFYDYKYAQGTLVPYRSVLWADDKIIEEMDIQTITFGQTVEEFLFRGN